MMSDGGGQVTLGFCIGVFFAAFFLKHFLPSYFSEKGKNLATREDIGEITRKVEEVRSEYLLQVESLKAMNQLRLAALDRRLEVHQQAFLQWRKVMAATLSEEVGKVVIDCQRWWEQNCIYLEPEVRKAFVVAYSAANMHHSLINCLAEDSVIKANWDLIADFPRALFEAIQLPELSELELRALSLKSN
jgi:hypothetical protein